MVQSLGRGLFITDFVAFLAAGLCSTRLCVIEKEGDISHQLPPHLPRAGKRRSFDACSKETRRRSGASWRPTTQDSSPSPGPTSPIPRPAEEVVQETWLVVLEGLPRFEGRSSLKTWIFRILANRAKTRAVREKRSIPFSALAGAPDEPAVDPSRFTSSGAWANPPRPRDEATPESLLLNRELLSRIEEALDRLPEGQRTVVLLRDVEGFGAEATCNKEALFHGEVRCFVEEGAVVVRGRASGFAQEIQVGDHRLTSDEPASAGGTDTGPTPYDLLLAALGA